MESQHMRRERIDENRNRASSRECVWTSARIDDACDAWSGREWGRMHVQTPYLQLMIAMENEDAYERWIEWMDVHSGSISGGDDIGSYRIRSEARIS